MHLERLDIKNFRLLQGVALTLEETSTLIVGRNNSGKTSLTELLRRVLASSPPSFQFEDFSLSSHEQFWAAFILSKQQDHNPAQIRSLLPAIEVALTIRYDLHADDLGALSEFVIDLDPECSTAVALVRYALKEGSIDDLFASIPFDPESPIEPQREVLCKSLKDRVPSTFETTLQAVDPNASTNTRTLEWARLPRLIQGGVITAQRGLDDVTEKERDVLGKVLEELFNSAASATAAPNDQTIADAVTTSVASLQDNIGQNFSRQLQKLLPAFELFGYPGLADPELRTETRLDVKRLLTKHTKVNYAGLNGINLPESYNGLGTRNLVFMLLRLLELFKKYQALASATCINLIFIEEPEVHLHPQMQEVFINKLSQLPSVFSTAYECTPAWPVQFIVTTHSSHVANKASFDSMRYFKAPSLGLADSTRATMIQDLRTGLGNTPAETREFLHKYMTLTSCDLLFADKAILVEGPTERLLLPAMIAKTDEGRALTEQLSTQYVSVLEVGGAYAHHFFDLLSFLGLRTLVITDLDSTKPNENSRHEACRVSEGTKTSNVCISKWFSGGDASLGALQTKTPVEKTRGVVHLAYQVPESSAGPCGRSFEDAFILANPNHFREVTAPPTNDEEWAWNEAKKIDKKTDFALKFAIYEETWNVPKYIADGLRWLAAPQFLDPTILPTNVDVVPILSAPEEATNAD